MLALGRNGGGPDTPGWQVRVVPNLYPAFERQEVVVHSPLHVRSFADLGDEQVALVAEAWRLRAAAEPRGYLHACVNEGRTAGASLAHSHSQLVWMGERPPALRDEDGRPGCALCTVLESTSADLEIARGDGVATLAASAGRLPYELLIAPEAHEVDGLASPLLATALRALRDAVRRLRAVEGPVPWNAWLHTGVHWHLELVPRLSVLAGVELGAGVYVNSMPPERAAASLRAVEPAASRP